MRRAIVLLAVIAALVAGVLLAQQARPVAAVNAYVDPAQCATCHAEIAKTYAKTGMGRSFSEITPEVLEKFPDKPYYHEPSDSYFAMVQRDGKTYQRRWQLGYDGRETNVEEKSVEYVLGSGNHGRTYLHLTPRHGLQQLPLGWYSENGGTWAMIPGFDRADYPGSQRPVHYECIFCHNAYPKIPKANEEAGAEVVYRTPLPNGIDCQRCHGPGQRHIETVSKAGVRPEEIRASIVNPKRLTPERELEDCMQCHLESSSLKLPHAVERQGHGPFSYVPGTPLESYQIAFDRTPGKNTRFEVAHAAYDMRASQCFLKTQGNDADHQLRCTTCHDPHNIPRGEEATTHYNGVCRTCHAEGFTRTVSSGAHPANPDCISCHMPKQRTDDAIHIVMTTHFIQKRPAADLLAKKVEYYESDGDAYKGEVVPYYPAKLAPTEQNQLDVAAAQIKEGRNLGPGIPAMVALLQKYPAAAFGYYVDLAEAYNTAGDAVHSQQHFDEALRRAPTSTVTMLRLANAQIGWQAWPRAEATARRVIARAADDPVAWGLLGQALFQQNRYPEAKTALDKSIALDADMAEPHNYLAAMLVRRGDLDGAEKEFRAALAILPSNADWQANLAGLLASRGSIPEARFLFERSLKLNPKSVSARVNYARLLANVNLFADAEKQARAAVEVDPGNAVSHELWALILTSLRDSAGAVRELRTAVELQPDFWRAHYELGAALGSAGDLAGATAQLRLAVQGSDPDVKAAAQAMLQQSGR